MSRFEHSNFNPNLHIVLVGTLYSANIGSVARVMGNMGAKSLVLINPKGDINSKARQSAAGAQSFLNLRRIYSNLDEFYKNEGNGIRIGLTRRTGKLRNSDQLEEVLDKMEFQSNDFINDIYMFLGPEDDGLSAKDLENMHFIAELPSFGPFPSMNLSHAALLGCFIIKNWISKKNKSLNQSSSIDSFDQVSIPSSSIFPDEMIKDWLTAMGFDVNKRRQSAFFTIKKLLLQNIPSEQEMNVLRAILMQNIRKLNLLNKNKSK